MDWVVVAACLVGVLSTARITRLVTQDSFPPAAWLRAKWDTITKDGAWSVLAHCHFCFSPYAGAAVLAWALLSELHVAWWVINGWLGGSYLASIVVQRDEGGA